MDLINVSLGGHQHSVFVANGGTAPLLLIHGFTGVKEDFVDEVDRLASSGFHVVCPDLLGHGMSDQPDNPDVYSLADYASQMMELAAHFEFESFDLLGHSMGGMIAQTMLLDVPNSIDRLVLMDTHHGAIDHVDTEIAMLGQQIALSEGLEVIQQLLKLAEDPLANEAYVRTCEQRPGYQEFCEAKMLASSQHMYAAMLGELIARPSRLEDLAAAQNETLVVVGELDEPFLEPSRQMAQAMPNATLVEIKTAGHCPQFEATDAWRSAVDQFLLAGIAP